TAAWLCSGPTDFRSFGRKLLQAKIFTGESAYFCRFASNSASLFSGIKKLATDGWINRPPDFTSKGICPSDPEMPTSGRNSEPFVFCAWEGTVSSTSSPAAKKEVSFICIVNYY